MKKSFFTLIGFALLLSGCGSSGSVSYHVTFNPGYDPTEYQQLATAAGQVIERRIESLHGTTKDLKVNVAPDKLSVDISATVSPPNLGAQLSEQLMTPYKFRLMRSAKSGEKPDISLDDKTGFMETGVTEKDLGWVTAGHDPKDATKGSVFIEFNTAGKEKVKNVFATTKGLSVAIFVRDRLISSFQNTTGLKRENIMIENVPAYDLAAAFADDTIVGAFMTFQKR